MKIMLKDGVYAEVKNVKIIFDLVDDNGKAIENENVKQSPNSVIEISGSDLENISISDTMLKLAVFNE